MPLPTRPGIIPLRHQPRLLLAHLENTPAHQLLVHQTPQHRLRDLLRRRPLVRPVGVAHELQFLGVLSPERGFYHARRHAVDPDPEAWFQRRQAADEAVHGVFGRDVDRGVQVAGLAGDAAYDEDAFGGCWAGGVGGGGVEEVRDGELGAADGVGDVHVERGVAVARGRVFALWSPRWVPEVGPDGVEDAGAWAHDVDGGEFADGGGEHTLQLGPGGYVGGLEDGAWRAGGVLREQVLGFWAQGQVCEEHVAAFGEEEFGEAVVYAWGVW